jgi:hypothetical protein
MNGTETRSGSGDCFPRRAFAAAPAPTFTRQSRMNDTVSRLPLLEFLLT